MKTNFSPPKRITTNKTFETKFLSTKETPPATAVSTSHAGRPTSSPTSTQNLTDRQSTSEHRHLRHSKSSIATTTSTLNTRPLPISGISYKQKKNFSLPKRIHRQVTDEQFHIIQQQEYANFHTWYKPAIDFRIPKHKTLPTWSTSNYYHWIFCPHHHPTTTDSATGPFTDFITIYRNYHQNLTFSLKFTFSFSSPFVFFQYNLKKHKFCVCFSLPPYACY